MKTLKLLAAFMILVTITSCTKEVVGPTGQQGATGAQGASTHTTTFTLDFSPSSTSSTYQLPSGTLLGKTAIVYMNKSAGSWTTLPYTNANPGQVQVCYSVDIYDSLDKITINTTLANGSPGSPWLSKVTLVFKLVVID